MAIATARRIVERAGKMAGLSLSVHSHMLRHACGFYLASRGHDTRAIQAYLDHRNIQHMRSGIFKTLFTIQNCLPRDFKSFGWIDYWLRSPRKNLSQPKSLPLFIRSPYYWFSSNTKSDYQSMCKIN